MAELSNADLPNSSISRDLLSENTANERFPTLQEDPANLTGKNQNQNTSKSTKMWLNDFNEWKVSLAMSWIKFFAVSSRKFDKNMGTHMSQKAWLLCSALWTVIWRTVAGITLFCEIMNLHKQDNDLKRKQKNYEAAQGYGKGKNASHALSEADKEFLWDSGHLRR